MKDQEPFEIRMYHPDEKSIGSYEVIQIESNQFKLNYNDPFLEELTYGVQFEVEENKTSKGEYIFKKITKESEFTSDTYTLPSLLNETELRKIGDKIIESGGYWEVMFGGIAYVNLPKGSEINILKEFEQAIESKKKL